MTKLCDECETVAHCTKHGCTPKVPTKDAAMKLALEALESKDTWGSSIREAKERAITALRSALAEQPAQRTWVERGWEESPRAKDRQVGGDHYKAMGVQPWDVVDTWPREQRIGYYRGGALKYLMRMGSKDESPMEVAKGQHYIQKLLEVLNEQD